VLAMLGPELAKEGDELAKPMAVRAKFTGRRTMPIGQWAKVAERRA
jgi:hypothetical protein